MTSCVTSHIKWGKMPVITIWILVTCTLTLGLSLLLPFHTTHHYCIFLLECMCWFLDYHTSQKQIPFPGVNLWWRQDTVNQLSSAKQRLWRPAIINKAFRCTENLFIQRFLFIHPRFVFIVQGSLLVVQ